MRAFTRLIFLSGMIVVALIGLTSYVLLNNPALKSYDCAEHLECTSNGLQSSLLTSTGDFLGFYTELQAIPNQLIIDVISFWPMNGAAITLSNSWATKHYTQTSNFTPTNGTSYDPVLKELFCLISREEQLITYQDNPMTSNLFNVAPSTATAPVFLNGTLFGIEVENSGYASGAMVDFDIISIDPTTGLMNGIVPLQFTTSNPTSYKFDYLSMSSATNRIDEIYFISGSNLIIVQNPSVSTTTFCYMDLEPFNIPTDFTSYYGLEYRKPGVLLAFRENITNGIYTRTEVVEILFNTTNCTVTSVNVLYDLQSNLTPSLDGPWTIDIEYYSTTYYPCSDAYYISTKYEYPTRSRLIEVDLLAATHFEQIFPDYLFGIEWKQNPCSCEANFVYQQFSSCDKFNFINTSTGSTPMTCHWDFGDPNSGTNNTSAQCVDMHQFSTCGTYNVCLTINANGCIKTTCQTVTVTDIVPPVALCKTGVVIALDANCVATLQGSDIDNGSFDNCQLQSLNVSQTTFNACGNYPVTLTATDWCGNTATCNTMVQVVDNFPPVIICPADKYLSTIDPSCTMIVNGLQWVALADNCGTPTITYTVTSDTQHSGVGDASGLLFNEGVSVVTYTATDNCGNTAQCSFKVDLTCVCHCTNNMVQNPGFNLGAIYGFLGSNGYSNNWFPGPTPGVVENAGCCDPYKIYLFASAISSPNSYNRSIYQPGFNFIAYHHYKVSFSAQKIGVAWPGCKIGINTTSTPLSLSFDPSNCTTCENIGISPTISNTSWTTYTLPIWTPNQNWDILFIRAVPPSANFSGYVNIDNICIEEVFYICCSNENAFIDNSNNTVDIRVDEIDEEAVIEIGNLLECNRIAHVDWGDGSDTTGPFGANIQLRHQYPDSNKYEIKVTVQESDSSDQVCFETLVSDSAQVKMYTTKYIGAASESSHNPNSGITKWTHDFISRDKGGRINPGSSKYNLESALLKPISFPDPVIDVLDDIESPVTTEAGEIISFIPDDDVAIKVELLSPAPTGYSWKGYRSNLLTPTASPTSVDFPFSVSFTWLNLPAGSQDSSGFMWISDNKDELYGEQILDGFGFFQPAELDTTTAIQREPSLQNIQLYPNPAQNIITIKWGELITSDLSIEIIDCSGRMLQKKNLESDILQSTIDVSMLEEGLYFIKILRGNKPVRVLKFVKAR